MLQWFSLCVIAIFVSRRLQHGGRGRSGRDGQAAGNHG